MKGILQRLSPLLLLICIAGCGSGGGTTGNGNTVYISASTKSGAPAAIFPMLISGVMDGNITSFTVTSTPYSTTGTIPNSNVQIDRVSYSFTPVAPATAFTPTVSYIAWPGTITPGGTASLDNVPVLWSQDYVAFNTACKGKGNRFDVTVTISGVEANTGAALSTDTHITAFCP